MKPSSVSKLKNRAQKQKTMKKMIILQPCSVEAVPPSVYHTNYFYYFYGIQYYSIVYFFYLFFFLDKKNQKSRQNDASPRKAYAGSPSCRANAHVIITLFRPICDQMVLIFNIAIQQGNNMAL